MSPVDAVAANVTDQYDDSAPVERRWTYVDVAGDAAAGDDERSSNAAAISGTIIGPLACAAAAFAAVVVARRRRSQNTPAALAEVLNGYGDRTPCEQELHDTEAIPYEAKVETEPAA